VDGSNDNGRMRRAVNRVELAENRRLVDEIGQRIGE